MTTKTTVKTTTKTTPTPRRRGPVNPQSLLMQQIAAHWNTLSGTQKNDWNFFTQQINSPLRPAAATRTPGFATFVALNSTLLNSGSGVLLNAPAQPDIPAALPFIELDITGSGSDIALAISPEFPTTTPILVYGTAPLLASRSIYDNTPFKLLGTVAPTTGPADITDLYLAQFYIPGEGYQIVVRLVGVSSHGFRSAPVLAAAPAPGTSAAVLQLKAA